MKNITANSDRFLLYLKTRNCLYDDLRNSKEEYILGSVSTITDVQEVAGCFKTIYGLKERRIKQYTKYIAKSKR